MKTFLAFLSVCAIIYGFTAPIIFKKTGNKLPLALPAILTGIFVLVCSMFIVIVPAQVVGVVITPNGIKPEVLYTGWHFVPFWNKIVEMDKTTQVYTCAKRSEYGEGEYNKYKADATHSSTVWAPTSDGIKMGFDISASWRIDPVYAWWIYDNVSGVNNTAEGRFYWLEENVIKPKLKSSLALTVSRYDPISVYSTKREEIQEEAFNKMREEVKSYHLELDQIDIREVYYNDEYETAINAKKLEEQKALTLIEITKQKREQETQAEIDKNIAIQLAQGEAEALRIKGQSVASNPKIVELQWIEKWNGQLPVYMMGSGQGVMLNLNKP